jgi:two-component system cell cycle sensor histidine kinase/response regulator CckA
MTLQNNQRRSRQLEAIGKLSPAVAHDINNLLSGILGYSQIVLTDPAVGYLKPHVAEIEKAGKRIASLVRILQVFRHRSVYRPETLNLNNVIQEMEKYFPLIIGPQIDFCSVKDPELWSVRADLAQIRQALISLAIDMPDILPQGGAVSLETRNFPGIPVPSRKIPDKQEPTVLIILSATGASVSDKLFLNSSEGDTSTTSTSDEMISETATTAEIIYLCGGQISINNREEHKLTVHISLPAAVAESVR